MRVLSIGAIVQWILEIIKNHGKRSEERGMETHVRLSIKILGECLSRSGWHELWESG